MKPPHAHSPLQKKIEALMKRYREEGRWESIALFSSEGLLMAGEGQSGTYQEDQLLEFSFSLIELASRFRSGVPVCEITVSGEGGTRLVFQYFDAGNEQLVLAAVHRGRRGYRRAMQGLVKQIHSIL